MESLSHSVMSESLWHQSMEFSSTVQIYSPWNSPGENTGMGSLSLLQVIFPTQGSKQVSHNAGGFFTSWVTGKPKNTGTGSLSLLQQIFLIQELNRGPALQVDSFFFSLFFFSFISWRLITLQYCSGFCHTLTWISHGVTCIPHPDPPSHLPLHPIPLGLPHAPGPSTCLMHPTWAGDLFHPR